MKKTVFVVRRSLLGWFMALIGAATIAGAINVWNDPGKRGPLALLIGAAILAVAIILIISGRKIYKAHWAGIASVKIVDVDSKTSAGSALARGAVGDLIGGPVGAVVGASTAKQKKSTTFLITYTDGRRETRTVPNTHSDYKKLILMVE